MLRVLRCGCGSFIKGGAIVTALSFSPDGKMLAVGLSTERTGKPGTQLWDVTTRQRIGELLPSTEDIRRIVFRPDGRALLAGTNGWTRLWDTIGGQALTEQLIQEEAGGFRRDGRAFLTVGADGTVKIRDAKTGEVLGRFLTSSSPVPSASSSSLPTSSTIERRGRVAYFFTRLKSSRGAGWTTATNSHPSIGSEALGTNAETVRGQEVTRRVGNRSQR
jgi:WD40 repeat protein